MESYKYDENRENVKLKKSNSDLSIKDTEKKLQQRLQNIRNEEENDVDNQHSEAILQKIESISWDLHNQGDEKETLNRWKSLRSIYTDKAKYEYDNWNYENAIKLYQEVLKTNDNIEYNALIYEAIWKSYFNQGQLYFNEWKYKEAILLYQNALNCLQNHEDVTRIYETMSKTFREIWALYFKEWDFDKALKNFQDALEINKNWDNTLN